MHGSAVAERAPLRSETDARERSDGLLRMAAFAVIAGLIASGPVAVLVVELVRPQPPWRDAATFARSYHPVQALPYVLGFVLLAGFVAFIGACTKRLIGPARDRLVPAIIAGAVYATFVSAPSRPRSIRGGSRRALGSRRFSRGMRWSSL